MILEFIIEFNGNVLREESLDIEDDLGMQPEHWKNLDDNEKLSVMLSHAIKCGLSLRYSERGKQK